MSYKPGTELKDSGLVIPFTTFPITYGQTEPTTEIQPKEQGATRQGPLTTNPLPSVQKVIAFDLPQKLLGTRALGIRLVTRPTTFPYSSDISTEVPQVFKGTRGGIQLIPIVYPPPWWNPLPSAIRKWNYFDPDRKWSNLAVRRWTYTVRGYIQ